MAYFGKEFVLDRQENFEAFVNSLNLGVPPEILKIVVDFKPTTKIVKNGDEYTLTSTKFDGGVSTTTFKSGVEFEENQFGKTAKTVVTVDGDTFTQVQKYPEGTVTYKRTFTPTDLTLVITNSNWDGEAKRYYKAK